MVHNKRDNLFDFDFDDDESIMFIKVEWNQYIVRYRPFGGFGNEYDGYIPLHPLPLHYVEVEKNS